MFPAHFFSRIPRKWAEILVAFLFLFLLFEKKANAHEKELRIAHEIRTIRLPTTVNNMVLSPDGEWLAVATGKEIHVLRAKSGKPKSVFTGHPGTVRALAFSPDSKTVASGGSNSRPRLWETETGRETLSVRGPGLQIEFLPSGKSLITSYLDDTIRWFDIGNKDFPVKSLKLKGGLDLVAFSPDFKWLAGDCTDKTIKIVELASGKQLHSLESGVRITRLRYNSDGSLLASVGFEEKFLRIWDPKKGLEIRKISTPDRLIQVVFSPDGKWIAAGTGSSDKSARVWEAATGREVLRLHDPSAPIGAVSHLAFSPKSELLVAASLKELRFWELHLDRLTKDGQLVTVEAKPPKKK
jgi:WD40 repeat protein